jgi:hypothetical protein
MKFEEKVVLYSVLIGIFVWGTKSNIIRYLNPATLYFQKNKELRLPQCLVVYMHVVRKFAPTNSTKQFLNENLDRSVL